MSLLSNIPIADTLDAHPSDTTPFHDDPGAFLGPLDHLADHLKARTKLEARHNALTRVGHDPRFLGTHLAAGARENA